MDTKINTEDLIKNEENIESNSINKNMTENFIESDFDLNLTKGTEAYYSERYGWTLRRRK